MLKGAKVVRHGVKDKHAYNVIITQRSHRKDSLGIVFNGRKCLLKRFIVFEIDF